MSADVRNPGVSRSAPAQSPATTHPRTSQFVRLSQLRKLRECQQVAAVCYRVRGGSVAFLLVRTRGSRHWTFPKGSAEPGLTHAQAAALEAFEEAGVHGRIEEASFARYVRRRGSGQELAVNTHLCEVLRLSPAPESNRNRTWFSAEDTKQRLREGRDSSDGAELARVVDKAVARIRQLHDGSGFVDQQPQYDGPQQARARLDAPQRDALQKVQFDFAEARGREASFMPYLHRFGGLRQLAVPVVDARLREVRQGEILQFDSPRDEKTKTLGAGTKNGSETNSGKIPQRLKPAF